MPVTGPVTVSDRTTARKGARKAEGSTAARSLAEARARFRSRNAPRRAGCRESPPGEEDRDQSCPRFMAMVRTPTSASTMARAREAGSGGGGSGAILGWVLAAMGAADRAAAAAADSGLELGMAAITSYHRQQECERVKSPPSAGLRW